MKQDLLFLKQKIEELKIAHFKDETDSVLPLPNNIISTLKVDEQGYIWFFTACKQLCSFHYIDEELSVYLDYYRKEKNCRLLIFGKARIEKEDEKFLKENSHEQMILLKAKIIQAEYYKKGSSFTFKGKIRSVINYFMASNPYKLYDFSSLKL